MHQRLVRVKAEKLNKYLEDIELSKLMLAQAAGTSKVTAGSLMAGEPVSKHIVLDVLKVLNLEPDEYIIKEEKL